MAIEANVGALHGNLLTALGTSIVSGEYPPGQVLTLDGVSAQHGLSRSVAREAIRVLESMGMVESRRRVGITIQPSHKWNVFDPRLIRWRLEAGDRAAQLVSFSSCGGGSNRQPQRWPRDAPTRTSAGLWRPRYRIW